MSLLANGDTSAPLLFLVANGDNVELHELHELHEQGHPQAMVVLQ